MNENDFSQLSEETLATFIEIEDAANKELNNISDGISTDSFAGGNTLTGGAAYQNLADIKYAKHEALQRLRQEPAIARLVLEDAKENQRIIYIARDSNLSLPSRKEFASYRSPLGRFAEIPAGEEAYITMDGQEQRYLVIEKSGFHPEKDADGWDSRPTQYRHYIHDSYSIESLRALLHMAGHDDADELDRQLEQEEAQQGISKGISHQVRTAMGLRDQPILDQFQGEIFRLPLDSQLIILGPPGTGKTTTLIKRLGQKLDVDNLETDDLRLIENSNSKMPHQSSWLMFTPSDLLKHYLKEAFSREQVPASDGHIRTWASHRNNIARNTFGILRTANGGKFTLKTDATIVVPAVIKDSSKWHVAFRHFHERRLRQQLKDGLVIVSAAAPETDKSTIQQLQPLADKMDTKSLVDIYRSLDAIEADLKNTLADSKSITDELLKKERNRLYNSDKEVFHRLVKHLETMQQVTETDDEELFDDDEPEEAAILSNSKMQIAVRAYLSSIRALARNKYLKRNLPKNSRSGVVIQFLKTAVPNNDVLVEIGRHISFQNGLRRFIRSHKRYVTDVAASYQNFRKTKKIREDFYEDETINTSHVSGIELDTITLLMLRNARQLMTQSFVSKELDAPRFSYLVIISQLFRNQIMVDEATDFSMLELACMQSLTTLKNQSFFACGDFNQRITTTGIRNREQLSWISTSLSIRAVQLVYRQSRKLNAFTEDLLHLQGGDLSALGKLPSDSSHEGVNPVLYEHAADEDAERWIAKRIKEVERTVQKLPTIAVLVNSEKEVKPTAERLTHYLEDVNLSAVACEEGKALGEGTDVRVFDIQHIKGLEFEAVFFVGIDILAEEKPNLFDRYLYVGATRAATYLGLICQGALPAKLEPLREKFEQQWNT